MSRRSPLELAAVSMYAATTLIVLLGFPAISAAETVTYYYFKKAVELSVLPGTFAVAPHDSSLPRDEIRNEIASVRADAVLKHDFGDYVLFALPNASAPPEGPAPEPVRNLVGELAVRLGHKYEFGPLVSSVDTPGVYSTFDPKVAVRFIDGVSARDAARILAVEGLDIEVSDYLGMNNAFRTVLRAAVRTSYDALDSAARLAQRMDVLWASPLVVQLGGGPSSCQALSPLPTSAELTRSPAVSELIVGTNGKWGVTAEDAWALCGGQPTFPNPDVVVGVVGDGVDASHLELGGRILVPSAAATCDVGQSPPGCIDANFVDPGIGNQGPHTEQDGQPIRNCDYHETLVAGVITMTSGGGTLGVGIGPKLKIRPARGAWQWLINPAECRLGAVKEEWISEAVDHVASSDDGPAAKVVNLSWNFFPNPTTTLDAKINSLHAQGVVVVNSSGNRGLNEVDHPGKDSLAWSVGSINLANGNRSTFSNYGPNLDFVAPGDLIYSTDRDNYMIGQDDRGLDRTPNIPAHPQSDGADDDYSLAGTSFAAPMVSAAAALALTEDPGLDPERVYRLLCSTAYEVWLRTEIDTDTEDEYGCGLIDVRAAVAGAGASYDPVGLIRADDVESGNLNRWSKVKP